MKQLITCVALLLAAGCKVGPDYHPPQMTVDGSFGPAVSATTQPTARLTTQPAASGDWWKLLRDPLLDSLMQRCARQNLQVKIAAARVAEARAYHAISEAALYPQLALQGGYTANRLSKNAAPYNAFNAPNFPWSFDSYSAGFDASWEPDLFGGSRREVEAANADVEANLENQRGVLLSMMGEVARNYVELRGYQQGLEIARNNLEVQGALLGVIRDRQQKGVAADIDVARSEAQVAATEAQIPVLEAQQWQAIHRLAVLLGEDLDKLAAELLERKAIPVPPEQVPVGVAADMIRRRPDIRRAERQVAAATARIGVARADLYPKLTISGSFSLQSQTMANLFERNSRNYAVGPSVSYPIFDAGRVRAVVKAKTAQQEQTLLGYEQTVRQAIEEVRNAAVSFSKSHVQRLALARAVAANEQAVSLSRQLYEKGLSDLTTVLDSQRQLYQSQDALVRSETFETTSLIALYKALGGGWESELPETRQDEKTSKSEVK